jgi:hypothetical protein
MTWQSHERFTYYSAPAVHATEPRGGPINGGTRVRVLGSWSVDVANSTDGLRCRFGQEVVRATRESGSSVLCEAPAAPRTAATRRIARAQAVAGAQAGAGAIWSSVAHATLHETDTWQVSVRSAVETPRLDLA